MNKNNEILSIFAGFIQLLNVLKGMKFRNVGRNLLRLPSTLPKKSFKF